MKKEKDHFLASAACLLAALVLVTVYSCKSAAPSPEPELPVPEQVDEAGQQEADQETAETLIDESPPETAAGETESPGPELSPAESLAPEFLEPAPIEQEFPEQESTEEEFIEEEVPEEEPLQEADEEYGDLSTGIPGALSDTSPEPDFESEFEDDTGDIAAAPPLPEELPGELPGEIPGESEPESLEPALPEPSPEPDEPASPEPPPDMQAPEAPRPEPPALTSPPPPPRERTEPPSPPPFLRPAEPELPPQARVPVPVEPPPEPPARLLPESSGEEIVFSRVVRAIVGQMIEIPFRGTGWVYLGELGNRRGISYDSRRLDLGPAPGTVEGQSFIFRAELAGTYILKFYRQDFIQDFIINDHVQVIVGEASYSTDTGSLIDRGRVIAEPRWPTEPAAQDQPTEPAAQDQPPEERPAPAESAAVAGTEAPPPRPRQVVPDDGIVLVAPPQAASSPSPQRSDSSSMDLSDDASAAEYVRRAKQEFDAGRIEAAISLLDAMKQRFPSGTDEAWWLYGQLLEANSSSRDIRLALEYYRRLLREYPQSPRAADAQRRIAYLERYYFNIR